MKTTFFCTNLYETPIPSNLGMESDQAQFIRKNRHYYKHIEKNLIKNGSPGFSYDFYNNTQVISEISRPTCIQS